MIKLQDFARECGVTDRAIQKHLKTYAAELDGLYERKGSNGTWLSDEACQILRSKMKQLPPAVVDGETARKNAALEERVKELEKQLSEKEKLVALSQQQVHDSQAQVAALQEKAGRIYALEEGKKALESKVEALTEESEEARKEADQLRQENAAMAAELAKISGMGPLKRLFYKPQKGE